MLVLALSSTNACPASVSSASSCRHAAATLSPRCSAASGSARTAMWRPRHANAHSQHAILMHITSSTLPPTGTACANTMSSPSFRLRNTVRVPPGGGLSSSTMPRPHAVRTTMPPGTGSSAVTFTGFSDPSACVRRAAKSMVWRPAARAAALALAADAASSVAGVFSTLTASARADGGVRTGVVGASPLPPPPPPPPPPLLLVPPPPGGTTPPLASSPLMAPLPSLSTGVAAPLAYTRCDVAGLCTTGGADDVAVGTTGECRPRVAAAPTGTPPVAATMAVTSATVCTTGAAGALPPSASLLTVAMAAWNAACRRDASPGGQGSARPRAPSRRQRSSM